MEEKIGKITLDDRHYPGEDFYCDGAVEDELLEIVKKYDSGQFRRVIEERAKWPVLYHLSPLRENIVDWLPMDKSTKVLEIGSGCGAITGKLAGKAGSVTCVELSKKRSLINAYRHQDCGNVTIHLEISKMWSRICRMILIIFALSACLNMGRVILAHNTLTWTG